MTVVELSVLEKRLAEYVRMATAGERFLVTDRDRVVAELVPPQDGVREVEPGGPLPDLLAELDRDRADR